MNWFHMRSLFFAAGLVFLGLLAEQSPSFADSEDHVFGQEPVGVGIGVETDFNSNTKAAASTNATFSVREFYRNRNDKVIALASLNVDYNVIGINTFKRGATGIGIRFDGGVFADLRVDREDCGLYAGASGRLDGVLWANQPGSSSIEVDAGPETGLFCRINDDVIVMLSPSVTLGAAAADTQRNFQDPSGGITSGGIRGGVVARFVTSKTFFATFRVDHFIKSFEDNQVLTKDSGELRNVIYGAKLTTVSADVNYKLNKNWMINFFAKYLNMNSNHADARGVDGHRDLRVGTNLVRTF